MFLKLVRMPSANGWTLGRIIIEGVHQCYTCEDVVRSEGKKVFGQTAIPAGIYRVVITHSPRFNRPLPLLLGVPGFEGVRIHAGNTAHDTEGCILPGTGHNAVGVTGSRRAFDDLYARIEAAIDRAGS